MTARRAFAALAAATLVAGAAAWYYLRADAASQGKKASAPPAVPVVMAKAALRDLPLTLEVSGRTEAFETVTLKSRVDGQVQAVPFAEGQPVARGEVLARLDAADFEARLRQAEANLARDQAQLAKARTDVERYAALKAKGFVSEEKVGEMRTAATAAEAAVRADQAAADLARLQLGYTAIRAPFDGVVGAKLVFPGAAIKANDTPLAVVNRVRPLYASFAVPEKYLARLRAGKTEGPRVLVAVPGEPPVEGELRFVDNAVDPATGTIQMKAVLANTDARLKPGQFVGVSLVLETLAQAVTVPTEAVQQGPQGAFLFVVADGVAQPRKIKVAAVQKEFAAIAEGLAAGESVVTDGQLRLTPGAKVRPGGTAPDKPPAR